MHVCRCIRCHTVTVVLLKTRAYTRAYTVRERTPDYSLKEAVPKIQSIPDLNLDVLFF